MANPAALPFTTDPGRFAFKLSLLDGQDGTLLGPTSRRPNNRTVSSGLLHGWDPEAAKALQREPVALDAWEQAAWGDQDDFWATGSGAQSCTTPEAVEQVLPSKWLAHDFTREVDTKMTRICRLCTALVDKAVTYSSGEPGTAPQSTAQWREHQALRRRVDDVVQLLEAALGECVPPLSLTDSDFVREAWRGLDDDVQHSVEALLGYAE